MNFQFLKSSSVKALESSMMMAAVVIVSAQAASSSWDPALMEDIREVAEKTFVTVECVSQFEGMGQSREMPRSLSGMIVSSTGLVMVMQNVEVISRMGSTFSLSRPEKIQILLSDRTRHPGTYIGADPDLDASFFMIDSPGKSEWPSLDFSSADLHFADEVFAVRTLPEEYDPRFDVAISRVSTVLTKPRKSYMTQPSLSQFNGYPAFNAEKKVIGFVLADDSSAESAALSMLTGQIKIQPSERFLRLINKPPTKVEKGWLGIRMEPLNQDLSEIWEVPGPGGIIVTSTVKGSPAEKFGVMAEDVIVEIDDQPLPVRTFADLGWFRQRVRDLKPDDTLKIKLIRGASSFGKKPIETKTVDLVLGLAPPDQTQADSITIPEIGLKVRALTLDVLFARRLPETMGGVIADYVENAAPADIGEVHENDIILSISGRDVVNLESVREILSQVREEKPKELILHVLRGHSRLFLKVVPDWE